MFKEYTINNEILKMNPFSSLIRFLEGKAGSFRFDSLSLDPDLRDLRYETVADGRRNMREDMRRLNGDWKKSIKAASEHVGKKD